MARKMDIKRALGISQEGGMGTYLGIPEDIRGSKKKVFAYIQDRLNSRTNLWSAKKLSKGGKEVQIKAVAQAIPTYVMSCFLLPKDVIDKLTSAIARFWWCSSEKNRGIHWMAWKKLCVPLDEGGLGFKDLRDFNIALLGKQLWRLMKYPDSLIARVLKGRYYRKSNPMETGKANSPSFGWRSIMAAKPLISCGLRRTIGTGEETSVWNDNWIPTMPARPALDNGCLRDPELKVHHLINFDTKVWNSELLHAFIDPEDIPRILSLRPSRMNRKDSVCWDLHQSGLYSGYKVASTQNPEQDAQISSEPSITELKKQVWKLKTTRIVKHFIWQALSGCVATTSRLVDRHCGTDRGCPRCGGEEESINHMIFECPPAKQCWALSPIPSHPGIFPSSSIYTNLDYLFWRAKENGTRTETLLPFPWLIWYIWKARNEKVFNGEDITPTDTIELANHEAEAWRVAQILEESMEEQNEPEITSERDCDTRWHEPGSEIRRCQVDASWSKEAKLVGFGCVVLQGNETVLFGLGARHNNRSSLHAELEGLVWAMHELYGKGIREVSFESDCAQLIKIINEEAEWPSIDTELEEFYESRQRFTKVSFVYIPRKANSRADFLAKASRRRNDPFSSVDRLVPQWLGNHPNLLASA